MRQQAMFAAAIFFAHSATLAIADERNIADDMHLGAASCASSVCHGKLNRQDGENVWLNEYRVWTRADKHSRAFRLLESEESRRIADNLGLARATTAKVCLDCHADNVPAEKRGPKFQISDGVSCEACHGGAGRWIKSHAVEGATHAENLANGMYPTESPVPRAELCLSCHMGNAEKFAGHDIMGAGHPRLSFELEAFTANQPAHFAVDDDYRSRKGEIPGFNLWLVGQVEAARRFAGLTATRIDANSGVFPELALFDCHACHHPMDDKRWTRQRAGPGIVPGSPRLQDQHLLIVEAVTRLVESDEARTELRRTSEALIVAGQEDVEAVRRAAVSVGTWLEQRLQPWSSRRFSPSTVVSIRKAILQAAADGRMSDFNAAEQVYLALESLSYSIGDRERLADSLDRIYAEVETATGFSPGSFASTARNVLGRF